MDYIYLFAGFVVLFASGDFLIKGSVSLAAHFKVSKMVIGIVIVSFGTSAPELVVSVNAALNGHPDISIGNVVGSNISNIALILGLTAIILPIRVKKKSIWIDWSVMFLATILVILFSLGNSLDWYEGMIFLTFLAAYVYFSIRKSRKTERENNNDTVQVRFGLGMAIFLVVVSSIGLIFGADLLVRGASGIARQYGISERVISVSLVAFGTSVPELATSIMAAIRKELDIFIGNIIGSNIFNILVILGITSLIKSIHINPMMLSFDYFWMLAISALLFIFILPLKKGMVSRWKGLIFVLVYATYIYIVYVQ